jgi:hypothetical protein
MDGFRTFVSRCAALINGRPITRVEAAQGKLILTPNHFLHGSLGGAVATEKETSLTRKWNEIQALLSVFWESYLKDYIPELKRMRKWKIIKPNVEVGELVLELDPNTPKGMWKLAVVEEVFPSKDGLVRKVKIRTASGLYVRPITQLCPLDVQTVA